MQQISRKTVTLVALYILVMCIVPQKSYTQSVFPTSKQAIVLSNGQTGASERWASMLFPTTATENYRLILPTTSPASGQFLSVASLSGNDATLQWSNIASSSWSLVGNSSLVDGTNNLFGTTDNIPIRILTNNIERMRILSSGNVGIGISTPDAPLQIGTIRAIGDALFNISNAQQNNQFVVKDRFQTSAMYGITSGGLQVGIPLFENTIWSSQLSINRIEFWNATSGNLTISSGNNIDLTPSGNIAIRNSDNVSRELRFFEPSSSGSNFSGFKAGAQASDINYTLPVSLPTNNGVLQTTPSGALSWSDLGAGNSIVTTSGGTATRVAFWSGTTSLSSNSNLFWDNTNSRLGIGTASPQRTLSVIGTDNSDVMVVGDPSRQIQFSAGNWGGVDGVWIGSLTNHPVSFFTNDGLSQMILTTGGDFGIGSTTPTSRLHINTTTSTNSRLTFTNTNTSGTAASDGLIVGLNSDLTATMTNRENSSLTFGTNNTERMRVTEIGRIGIGITSPASALHVIGSGGGTKDLIVNGRIQSGDAGGNGGIWLSTADDGLLGNNGGNIGFWTSGAGWNALQIVKSTGNIGIGLSSPVSKLHVDGGTSTQSYVTITNGATSGVLNTDGFVMGIDATAAATIWNREATPLTFGTSDGERMRIQSDGSVGIGTPVPQVGFHYVNNNAILSSSAGQTQNMSNYLLLGNLNNASYELRIQEPNGSGQNFSAFKTPIQSYNITYTLPQLVPTTNQVLSANAISGSSGAGYSVSLEWVNPTGGGGGGSTVTGTGVSGQVAFWTTATQITSDSRFYWDNSLLRLGVGTQTPDEKLDVEGHLIISNGNSLPNELRIAEPFYTTGNTNYTAFTTQSQSADLLYSLPAAGPAASNFGSNRFALATNNLGNSAALGWQTFWSPQGNEGTNPTNSFIGTVDNQPLVFRTNNIETMRLGTDATLRLRDGNGAGSFTANQLLLGWGGASDYQFNHALRTRHNSGGVNDNAVDIYLWKLGVDANTDSPTQHGLTVEESTNSANIGVGGVTSPKASLHLPNILSNRRIILWADNDNDHQFYGNGLNSGIMRYQIANLGASHVFSAGASSSTSNELMRIQGNGNVGIGTSTPGYTLEVNGPAIYMRNGASPYIFATGPNVGIAMSSTPSSPLTVGGGAAIGYNLAAPTNGMIVLGNTGIGTSSPTTRFHVNGTSRFTGGDLLLDTSAASTAGLLQFMNPARTFTSSLRAGAQTANITYTLPTTITPTGTVTSGVMMTDGSGNLSWVTPAGLIASSSWTTSGNATTTAWNGTTGSYIGTNSAQPLSIATTNATAQDIRFFTGANGSIERMRILSSGNIGIGVTTPTNQLHIDGGTGNNSYTQYTAGTTTGQTLADGVIVGVNSGGEAILWQYEGLPLRVGTNNLERLRINSNGNIGINNNAPSQLLHVVNGNVFIDNNDNTTRALQLGTNSSAGAFTTSIRAANGMTANVTLTLPTTAGSNGQVLTTNGSGNLSWTTPGTGSNWSLTGNASTSPSTNFIGTTDAQPLVFRTNNIEQLRINTNGNISTGSASTTNKLTVGSGALALDTITNGTAGQLRIFDTDRTHSTTVTIGNQAADITLTLPSTAPLTNNQILTATTAGVMSWNDPSTIVAGTQFFRKAADEVLTTNATLQDDDHLTMSIAANQSYEIEIVLSISTNNSVNGGYQFTVTTPTGATIFLSTSMASDVPSSEDFITTSGTTNSMALSVVKNKVVLKGYVQNASTAGTITLQWAQNTSSSAEARVKAGSYMKATRIQ